MKRLFLTSGLILGIAFITMTDGFPKNQQEKAEKTAIKQVVKTSYIDGIQNKGNIESIRKGFEPGFNLLMKRGNIMNKRAIEEWIKIIERGKQKNPDGPANKVTGKFVSIDITGDAAVVKLELYKNTKQIFTDYLFLYKFTNLS